MSEAIEQGAIFKLRKWEKEQLVEAKRRKDELVDQLLALVPESFGDWKAEAGEHVIRNLLEYGLTTNKYRQDLNDPTSYGYTDLKEFARRFKQLKKAWKGIVEIKISWDGTERFEAFFTPIH